MNKDIKVGGDRVIAYIKALPNHTVTKHSLTTIDDDNMQLEMTVYAGAIRLDYNKRIFTQALLNESCTEFVENELQRMLMQQLRGTLHQDAY